MSGKAKILGAVLAAAAAVLFFVLKHGTPVPQKDEPGGAMEDSVRSEIQKQFEGAASILNKDAPKKMDEATTLLRADAGPGLLMTYRYALSGVSGGETELSSLAESSRRSVTERVCQTGDMRDYMEYGASYRYIYEDSDGKELFRFTVDGSSCLRSDAEKKKTEQ